MRSRDRSDSPGLTYGRDDFIECRAADKRYDFFFVAPALPVRGAVGAPVVPMAFK